MRLPPPFVPAPEPYLSTNQVLAVLGISRATLNRWIVAGLPAIGRGTGRHLRFRMSEIEIWMAGQANPNYSNSSSSHGITG